MTILYINLVVVFLLSLGARYFAMPAYVTSTYSPVEVKPSRYLIMIATLTIILVSGLRRNIGDTYFYIHYFEINDFTWDFILSQKDIGFGILQMVLKSISEEPQILILCTALITNAFIAFTLYKYSRMIELSLYVYITSGLFLVSMNGIRQFLAAAIIFAATKYIMDGSWKKFTIIILIASTFHQSALIFIPIYFLIRRKAWTRTTFILITLSLIIVVAYNRFSSILFSALSDTQYGHYSDFSEGGASIVRVIVYAAPLLLAYLGREKLRIIFPNSDYIVNLCILNLIFMVIASQNWIFARFTIYFGLFNLILISWVVKLVREKDQKLLYFGIIICYFIYFYYEHVVSLNIEYKSNFF
ncbi:EpsG family protein [Sutcliffiella rhizosphaerae]|uniref:Transmembrane protein EpsG n=1 Tax=Sutcliffiella rhizosphaerae TaxID=2880967 RepID=A0ABN8AA34_9BACI|nr:EpsG family protein [Sutcliffiella rhizosphaerae]CAG9620736.1 Transmembrane protein EpsG [Sutcliffiella rhizosphaerae]